MSSSNTLAATLHEFIGFYRRKLMGNFYQNARNHGLTMAQFGTMMHIYHKGACGVSDIGADLGVSNSAASQMLERLVQLQLITRSEDPSDRRVKQIELTEKGHQLLRESNLAFQAWLENLAQSMTAEEQEQVKTGLDILTAKTLQLETKLE